MITFDNVERNYEIAKKIFSIDIPEFFNFAFDVLDVRAQEAKHLLHIQIYLKLHHNLEKLFCL